MRRDELQFLLDYDIWATERVLAAAEQLIPAEFAAEAGPGHVAPRGTLLHSLTGMRNWRVWLQGTPAAGPAIDEGSFPTLAAVRSLCLSEYGELQAYVAALADGDLDEVVEQRRPDRLLRGPRWQMLVHIVNHDMQHRSELAQALTLLGHSPGELGITAFLQHRLADEQPAP